MTSPGYVIVDPDPELRPMPDVDWRADLIDYRRHEAYRDLAARADLPTRLKANTIFFAGMAKLLLKRTIRYEMIPYDVRADRSAAGRLRFAGAALRNMAAGSMRKRHAGGDVPAEGTRLDQHGVMVLKAPGPQVEKLEQVSSAQFEVLAARRGKSNGQRKFEESRGQASRIASNDLFSQIESLLAEAGVMAASDAYLGRPARLIDVNPQINDVSDSFWRDIFPDMDADQLPATAYCHRDASGGDLKAIIYLSDVGERNGPFSYVLGSNRMRISKLDDLICEANDSNGLGATEPEARRLFAALPARLRQKGAFGNDLTPDAAISADINAGLWAIQAPKGSIVLFDTKGIHRGGMVVEGERRVITCVIG